MVVSSIVCVSSPIKNSSKSPSDNNVLTTFNSSAISSVSISSGSSSISISSGSSSSITSNVSSILSKTSSSLDSSDLNNPIIKPVIFEKKDSLFSSSISTSSGDKYPLSETLISIFSEAKTDESPNLADIVIE